MAQASRADRPRRPPDEASMIDTDNGSKSAPGQRVCLVVAGHDETVVTLAGSLAHQGYRVTLLDATGSGIDADGLDAEVIFEQLAAPGNLFVQLPYAARISYLSYLQLRQQDFDAILFPAHAGIGYYTQLARWQGIAFDEATIIVRFGATRSAAVQQDNQLVEDVTLLDEMYLEQRSVELADTVVCTDEAQLAWLRDEGWSLPQHTYVIPAPPPKAGGDAEGAGLSPNMEDWLALYRQLPVSVASNGPGVESGLPLVSVCLVHFNRPRLLARMIESLYLQDYDNFEVILVDDGSTRQDALDYLATLEPVFAGRGWRIIRQQNAYLGTARNNAANHARGDYLLFLDDDNVATTQLISTLVRVMRYIDVDILTCATNVFEGEGAAPQSAAHGTHWVPLGPSVASGMFRNVFGDATGLISKHVFDELGGFTQDYGIGHEDWELYARAVLQGYRLETVPEPLLYYRVRGSGMLLGGNREASLTRSLRPYLEQVPKELRPVLLLALGQEHSRQAGGGAGFTPAALLKLMRGFAGGGDRSGMIRRFVRVGRSQGWGVAIRAALRYSSQDR